MDCHAPVCSGDDSVWCNWCQSSTHRFCGNGLRIDDEQYLAYKRGELKIFFSCKICTENLDISYQGEVTFYQTPSVPKNGMNNTSIEFEIADLDVVSDNEIKEQLLKFITPQRPVLVDYSGTDETNVSEALSMMSLEQHATARTPITSPRGVDGNDFCGDEPSAWMNSSIRSPREMEVSGVEGNDFCDAEPSPWMNSIRSPREMEVDDLSIHEHGLDSRISTQDVEIENFFSDERAHVMDTITTPQGVEDEQFFGGERMSGMSANGHLRMVRFFGDGCAPVMDTITTPQEAEDEQFFVGEGEAGMSANGSRRRENLVS